MKRCIQAYNYTYLMQDIKIKLEDFLKIYMKFVNYDNVVTLMGEADKVFLPKEEPSWSLRIQPYDNGQLVVTIHTEMFPSVDTDNLIDKLNSIIWDFDTSSFFEMSHRPPVLDLFAIVNV